MKWSCVLLLVTGATLGSSMVIERSSNNEVAGDSRFDRFPMPSQEEIDNILREQCTRNGGEAAFAAARNALPIAVRCVRELMGGFMLSKARASENKRGDLGHVVRFVCGDLQGTIIPSFKMCSEEFYEGIDGCLTQADRDALTVQKAMGDHLLSYVCSNGGELITSFIRESGPQCFKDRRLAVLRCVKDSLEEFIPSSSRSIFEPPRITAERCRDVADLERCAVRELEECESQVPARFMRGLIRSAMEATPCTNMTAINQE